MKRNKRRLPIPQHEFGFVRDTFVLIQERGLDGDRLARERAEADEAHQLVDAAQARLFTPKTRKQSVRKHISGHQNGHQKSKNRLEKIVQNSVE